LSQRRYIESAASGPTRRAPGASPRPQRQFASRPCPRQGFQSPVCCGEMRNMVVHRQRESSSVITFFPSAAEFLAHAVDQVNFSAHPECRARWRWPHCVSSEESAGVLPRNSRFLGTRSPYE